MGTIIAPCSCYSPFQDKVYGQGLRLHNVQAKDGKRLKKARCTVCGASCEIRVNEKAGYDG